DVEALHLAVDLRLEGRVGQVGAGGELARLDELDPAGGGLGATAAAVARRAGGHEHEPGRRGGSGQDAGPAPGEGDHGGPSCKGTKGSDYKEMFGSLKPIRWSRGRRACEVTGGEGG